MPPSKSTSNRAPHLLKPVLSYIDNKTVSVTGRFGDDGRKFFMRKKCVFLKYYEGYTTKDVCFISVFVNILMTSGQCSFPSVRNVEELSVT